jgi:hypothetical protein
MVEEAAAAKGGGGGGKEENREIEGKRGNCGILFCNLV